MTQPRHPTDVHVGKNLRVARHMRGMTQQQLAKACNVRFQQVQKYETGANRLSASKMFQCCLALKISPNALFDGLMEGQSSELPTLSSAATRTAMNIMLLNAEDRRLVVEMTSRLAFASSIQVAA